MMMAETCNECLRDTIKMTQPEPTARFVHGDCFDVLPRLAAEGVRADLVFCDLPYGAIKQDWDVKLCLERLWPMLDSVRKQVSTVIFTATFPFAFDVLDANRAAFKHDLIWDKTKSAAFGVAKYRPMPVHENVFIFGKSIKYNPVMEDLEKPIMHNNKGRSRSIGMARVSSFRTQRYPTSILRFTRRNAQEGLHATQKPIDLLRYLIRMYSDPGDTVLDPTAGSGTTAVGALLEGRHTISIEKDPQIYANASERVMAVRRSLHTQTPKDAQ